jgi:hypothetical protein
MAENRSRDFRDANQNYVIWYVSSVYDVKPVPSGTVDSVAALAFTVLAVFTVTIHWVQTKVNSVTNCVQCAPQFHVCGPMIVNIYQLQNTVRIFKQTKMKMSYPSGATKRRQQKESEEAIKLLSRITSFFHRENTSEQHNIENVDLHGR